MFRCDGVGIFRSSDSSSCLGLMWLPAVASSTCSSRRCVSHRDPHQAGDNAACPHAILAEHCGNAHSQSRRPDAKDSRRPKLGFRTQNSFRDLPVTEARARAYSCWFTSARRDRFGLQEGAERKIPPIGHIKNLGTTSFSLETVFSV